MKTAVIVSDTHGNKRALESLLKVFSECDYIIHLGDTSGDGSALLAAYPQKTVLINGNCDPVKFGENEKVLEIEGVKIFATHGHLYSAKHTHAKLIARAKELGCNIALYGHTHRAGEWNEDGITLVNPGTLSRYSAKTYAYMAVNGGKAVFKIVPLQ